MSWAASGAVGARHVVPSGGPAARLLQTCKRVWRSGRGERRATESAARAEREQRIHPCSAGVLPDSVLQVGQDLLELAVEVLVQPHEAALRLELAAVQRV